MKGGNHLNVNEYTILYFDRKCTTTTITCQTPLLIETVDKIIKEHDNDVCIYIQPISEGSSKVEKEKYYKSKYLLVRKKYKQGKIDVKEFEDDVAKLK